MLAWAAPYTFETGMATISWPTRTRSTGCIATVRGSRNVKRVPFPRVLWMARVPERASTLRFTASIPTPRPETSVTRPAVETPGRQERRSASGSGRAAAASAPMAPRATAERRRASGSIPRPSSVTSRMTRSRSRRADTSTRPVGRLPATMRSAAVSSPWSTALRSRWRTGSEISSSSARSTSIPVPVTTTSTCFPVRRARSRAARGRRSVRMVSGVMRAVMTRPCRSLAMAWSRSTPSSWARRPASGMARPSSRNRAVASRSSPDTSRNSSSISARMRTVRAGSPAPSGRGGTGAGAASSTSRTSMRARSAIWASVRSTSGIARSVSISTARVRPGIRPARSSSAAGIEETTGPDPSSRLRTRKPRTAGTGLDSVTSTSTRRRRVLPRAGTGGDFSAAESLAGGAASGASSASAGAPRSTPAAASSRPASSSGAAGCPPPPASRTISERASVTARRRSTTSGEGVSPRARIAPITSSARWATRAMPSCCMAAAMPFRLWACRKSSSTPAAGSSPAPPAFSRRTSPAEKASRCSRDSETKSARYFERSQFTVGRLGRPISSPRPGPSSPPRPRPRA